MLPGLRNDHLSEPEKAIGRSRPAGRDAPHFAYASGYFGTFETQLLQGREFTPADRAGSTPVGVVNDSFVRTYFNKGNAIGSRVRKGRRDTNCRWPTIVDVVPEMLMEGIGNNQGSPVGCYIPVSQSDITNFVRIALRTRSEPMAATGQVRVAVASLNRDLAIYDTFSMRDVIRRQTWPYRIFGTLFMAFGISALLLAMAGLYGVMSFAVAERTCEMGIRMALGAGNATLIGLVMQRGVVQILVCLAVGLGLALLAVTPMQVLLYHVEPHDPVVFVLVILALAGAGLTASLLPARLVTRIDPVVALTAE